MDISKFDIESVNTIYYGEGSEKRSIRVVNLTSGETLFVASDIAIFVLGVQNAHNLTRSVDERSKATVIVTFDEIVNPQKYIVVNMEGLRDMVYRARKSEVNKLDFIMWAQEKSVN